jgi:hypothetical protein
MSPCSYAYLIFDKGTQNIKWRKDSLFNKCFWENWISACRKLKLDPCLYPCTNINSKGIKDFNIRPEILKLVQERVGNTLEFIGLGNNFLNSTPMVQHLRERQLRLYETKILPHNKRNGQQIEEAPCKMEENLPAIHLTEINNHNIQGAQKSKLPKNQ